MSGRQIKYNITEFNRENYDRTMKLTKELRNLNKYFSFFFILSFFDTLNWGFFLFRFSPFISLFFKFKTNFRLKWMKSDEFQFTSSFSSITRNVFHCLFYLNWGTFHLRWKSLDENFLNRKSRDQKGSDGSVFFEWKSKSKTKYYNWWFWYRLLNFLFQSLVQCFIMWNCEWRGVAGMSHAIP